MTECNHELPLHDDSRLRLQRLRHQRVRRPRILFSYAVSSHTGHGLAEFREALAALLKNPLLFPHVGRIVPLNYAMLERLAHEGCLPGRRHAGDAPAGFGFSGGRSSAGAATVPLTATVPEVVKFAPAMSFGAVSAALAATAQVPFAPGSGGVRGVSATSPTFDASGRVGLFGGGATAPSSTFGADAPMFGFLQPPSGFGSGRASVPTFGVPVSAPAAVPAAAGVVTFGATPSFGSTTTPAAASGFGASAFGATITTVMPVTLAFGTAEAAKTVGASSGASAFGGVCAGFAAAHAGLALFSATLLYSCLEVEVCMEECVAS